jgi:hypothetical protein
MKSRPHGKKHNRTGLSAETNRYEREVRLGVPRRGQESEAQPSQASQLYAESTL